MSKKVCSNPDCTIENPQFFRNHGSYCTKCYSKKEHERQRQLKKKKDEELVSTRKELREKDEEVKSLKKIIAELTEQLGRVQVGDDT